MEFIRGDRLPGLKLLLTEDDKEMRRWYVFVEEDFADNQYWGESARKIVGCITIFWEKKRLDFHVNNFWFEESKINHQRKGYGTRIMYYIENVLAPLFPDFEITINNHQVYLDFKEHIEEKIRESLNVLVIGVDESLILELKEKGYKKIYNIKSYVAALTFLEEHIDIASHIHLVFFKKFADDLQLEIEEHLDQIFSYQPEEFNSYLVTPIQKDEVRFHFWKNTVPRIFTYYESNSRQVEYYSIATYDWIKSNYSLYLSYVERQIFPLLQVNHLKKEELPIVLPTSKKSEVKKLEDLRILWLTRGDNHTYYKEYLQKKGITHICMFEDNNYSYLRHAVNQLGDYDIVIASSSHSYVLLSNYLEAKEQAKLCGRDTTLLACYDDASVYDGMSRNNRIQYCLIDKEDVIKKDYSFQMLYDDVKSDEEHRDYEYVRVRIMETIIREYLDYINSKGASIPCEQFSSYLELQAECDALENKKQEENQKREAFYSDFDTLHNNVLSYLSLRNNTSIRRIEEVSIEEKNDYVRICFLLNGICKGAVSIPKKVQTKGRIFTMEILGKNGALLPPKEVILLYPGDDGDNSVPTLSENELRLLQGIYKRVKTYVSPMLEETGEKKKFVPKKKRQT